MPRIVQQRATRGSQYWLQRMVARADRRLTDPLQNAIGDHPLKWLSPLEQDGFAEYRDRSFVDRLGIELDTRSLTTFWPRGGPVWDGLARIKQGAVVLIEAKSHLGEMDSSLAATSERSLDLIQRSLGETALALGTDLTSAWTEDFYQYANRLAHLHLLRRENRVDAFLAFVYFVGDTEMRGPDSIEEWQLYLREVHKELGLPAQMPGVVDVFVDVR